MHGVTILWAMVASACLTLAVIHALVWWRERQAWSNLFFSLATAGTAGLGVCEYWMMQSTTISGFGTALRWLHVPAWVMILSLVGFVQTFLRSGRPWLAWTVCSVRTLSLVLNFVQSPNLNFREITQLRLVTFLGETVVIGEGVPNPWMLVNQASLLLLVVFAVDAAITAWRRGDRRRALVTIDDSGPGFDPARLDEVFDPFYTTRTEGMGLGLAICRSIVESHAGHIHAANRPEGGARVTIALPSVAASRPSTYRDSVSGQNADPGAVPR